LSNFGKRLVPEFSFETRVIQDGGKRPNLEKRLVQNFRSRREYDVKIQDGGKQPNLEKRLRIFVRDESMTSKSKMAENSRIWKKDLSRISVRDESMTSSKSKMAENGRIWKKDLSRILSFGHVIKSV